MIFRMDNLLFVMIINNFRCLFEWLQIHFDLDLLAIHLRLQSFVIWSLLTPCTLLLFIMNIILLINSLLENVRNFWGWEELCFLFYSWRWFTIQGTLHLILRVILWHTWSILWVKGLILKTICDTSWWLIQIMKVRMLQNLRRRLIVAWWFVVCFWIIT